MAGEKIIGKVTHYYDHLSVAILELASGLKQGDKLHFVGHGRNFEQTVSSMQVEHQNVLSAQLGELVGMKVDQPVKEGDLAYLVA